MMRDQVKELTVVFFPAPADQITLFYLKKGK